MSAYFDELCKAMKLLADRRATFMGQAVACEGTAMSKTFRDVPREQLLELPVAEDMQMGMATGMAMAGILPVCCFPRINFMLLATNQLVLHLDKLPLYSGYRPRVIIRTSIASPLPLHPGEQHLGDFTEAFRMMLKTIHVVRLETAEQIVPEYIAAANRTWPTLLVERMERY